MTPASILSAIQSILKNSSDLKYVADDSIMLGVRENVAIFPAILIEPTTDKVITSDFAFEQRLLTVNVTAYVQVYDKDHQLVGDANTKGVLDVENDIRKALSSDTTLGLQGVYDAQLLFSVHDFEQYPIRGFAINMEVHYKQDRLTRA
jgi:hypothetical protein